MISSEHQNILLSSSSYSSFCESFCFREETGFYIPYTLRLEPLYKPWYAILENIHTFLSNGTIQEKIDALPLLDISNFKSNLTSLVMTYAMMQALVTAYVHATTPPTERIPPQIAVPFYEVSQILKVSPSSSNLGYTYGWFVNGDHISFLQNFTGTIDEDVFFGTSTATGQILAQIMKILFKANLAVSENSPIEVIQCLKSIKPYIKEILDRQQYLLKTVRGDYYFKEIRRFIGGFSNKKIFPKGVFFEGVDQYITAPGGSAGQDPSFQMFENAMGIEFRGELDVLRNELKKTMMFKHIELIDVWKKHSNLRKYVSQSNLQELIETYNEIIRDYAMFYKKHSDWVVYYIEVQAKKNDPNIDVKSLTGTGNTPLIKIKKKWEEIEAQQLKFLA